MDGEQGEEPKEKSRWENISEESLALAHLFALVAVVVLLCLGGTYPQSDIEFSEELIKCLKAESWAPMAATDLAKSLNGLQTNHKSLDGVESAWSTLVMALGKYAGDNALWLGYGTGNGQFYSAVNCAAPREAETDYCRDSAAQFVVKAKSNPVFGDDFIHRYKFIAGGESGGGVFRDISSGDMPYYPRARPWFYTGMGAGENGTWGQYTDKSSGFQTASFGVTYDGGVVAAAISPAGSACFHKYGPKASESEATTTPPKL